MNCACSAVGLCVHSRCKWLLLFFLRNKLFVKILSSDQYQKCSPKTSAFPQILKLNSFEFQVVFLATIFILLNNAKEHCVTRQKQLQGSFKNTIYKVILMNKLKLGSVTLAAGFHSRNIIR